jgi:hypothetical protein
VRPRMMFGLAIGALLLAGCGQTAAPAGGTQSTGTPAASADVVPTAAAGGGSQPTAAGGGNGSVHYDITGDYTGSGDIGLQYSQPMAPGVTSKVTTFTGNLTYGPPQGPNVFITVADGGKGQVIFSTGKETVNGVDCTMDTAQLAKTGGSGSAQCGALVTTATKTNGQAQMKVTFSFNP